MNSQIISPRVNRPCVIRPPLFAGKLRLRWLAAGLTAVLGGASLAGDTYHFSGTATGSQNNPVGTVRLKKNDIIILDATKTSDSNFTPFTPWVAIDSGETTAGLLTNGNNSSYMGYKSGDPSLYNEFNPYARVNDLLVKTPSLTTLMPSFFTQSERVYVAGRIGQDNTETPDVIKAVTTNPFGVWPISIYSSDALDPGTGAPRPDVQNAAWVVLASTGSTVAQRVQLMNYYGEYVPVSGKGRPWDGSYSTITLEHVIFYGGYTTSSGGGLDFKRSDNLTGNANTRAIVQVKGDVAFVGNMAGNLGGAANGADSIQFDGNTYFVGNIVGASYDVTEKIIKFSTGHNTSFNGDGGAMRIGSGGQIVTFNKDATFIGNLAAASGGALSLHNNSTLQFNGKTVFMGNQSGLFMRPGTAQDAGNGGAIVFSSTGNRGYFAGESYFIGNEASGYGGALGNGNSTQANNGFFEFSGNALFTDNVSGFNPEIATVYSNTTTQKQNGVFPLPGNVATAGVNDGVWSGTTIINVFTGTLTGSGDQTYGAKIRGGGAIHGAGTYILFGEGAQSTFLRNSTNGDGGAIYISQNSDAQPTGYLNKFGAAFFDDATFVGNVAAINGGGISAGTYGPHRSVIWEYNSGTATPGAVYFGKAGAGSTLTMHGNIAYTAPKALSTDPSASNSNTAFEVVLSTGTTVRAANGTIVNDVPVFGGGAVFAVGGLYVESLYSFWHNQTGGSGGALLIGSGSTPELVTTRMGRPYSLVLNALDWKPAGSYSAEGDFALFQDNVAMRDGGAIGAHDGASLYIGSGAKFLNNYAGGEGGALALALASGQTYGLLDAPQLDLRARVADITFQGNRAGVTIDTSGVALDQILDSTLTLGAGAISSNGYLDLDPDSGRKNDIYVGLGASDSTSDTVATINMDAYEGMKISLDGGIEMDHGGTKNLVININTILDTTGTSIGTTGTVNITTNPLLANTTPSGLVWLDNAGADIEGVTTVGHGTLRISGTATDLHWGTGTSTSRAGTEFNLNGSATLEANAAINAETITLGDGATLRVLGDDANPGTLTLNAGSGGVVITNAAALKLAGNGRLNLGGTGTFTAGQIASISVGDVITSHASAQTLVIAKDAGTLADLALDNARLSIGLFSGNTSDSIEAAKITLTGATQISLTSLANGTFTIATAAGGVTDSPTHGFDYKGTALTSGGRLSISTAVASGTDLTLTYAASSTTVAGAAGSWTSTRAGTDVDFVLGDVVNFAADATVSVDNNVGAAAVAVTQDVTFTGGHGITTEAAAWGGSATSTADGRLTMSGTGKTLTLANATGAGQRNEFTGGILIQGGTVAAGTEAQLGAALSQITFANTTGNGAALLVTGEMLLDGATSLQSQQLNVTAGNTAAVATTANASLVVANNAVTGDGGVFNIGAGATLNLIAQGDMAFLNNTADSGGALALATGATANIDVAEGKTVMFGLQGDRVFRTAANISTADSISGAADSVINKNGAGILSLNSDSSDFAGMLNVNAGGVLLGEGSEFGSSTNRINVASGGLLGGAATLHGNVTVNGGRLSVDGGEAFDRPAATQAQTLAILGDLDLASASLLYSGYLNKSIEWSSDTILVGGKVDITGTTTVDFNFLTTGVSTLIQTGTTGYISLAGNTGLVSSGAFAVTNSGTILLSEKFVKAPDVEVSKGGVVVDPNRYETQVGYELASSLIVATGSVHASGGWTVYTSTVSYARNASGNFIGTITGEVTGTNPSVVFEAGAFPSGLDELPPSIGQGLVLVSQTNFYDTTRLAMDTFVHNQKAYWTGSGGAVTGTRWDHSSQNWNIPGFNDSTFAIGDSVIFGASGYDAGNEANRNIAVHVGGLSVADMTVTGSGNWTFRGGEISTNAGANAYKDANGVDLSTGQLVLDEGFTGTVSLLNSRVHFNGGYDSNSVKLPDVDIRNGTMLTDASVLNGNLIWNDSTLILQQTDNREYKDTRLYGGGDVIQQGAYKLTMKESGIIETGNYHLRQGTLEVEKIGSLAVAERLVVDPGATLVLGEGVILGGQAFNGLLVNSGTLRKSFYNYNNDSQKPPTDVRQLRDPAVGVSTFLVMGNYHGDGGTIELNTYRDAVMIHNLYIYGDSSGTSKVVIKNITAMDTTGTTSGTYFQPYGMPASKNPKATPKRDTLVVATQGANRNLKLVMDWGTNAYNIPSATIGSKVPFLSLVSSTNVVTSTNVITVTTMANASGTNVRTDTTTSSGTTIVGTGTLATAHFYDEHGNVASLGTTGNTKLGESFTVTGTTAPVTSIENVTTGTITVTSTNVVVSTTTVVTSTNVVVTTTTTYGPSEIDYSESRDNYKLIQGRNGNWYFRNESIALQSADLPAIGMAPAVADLLAQNGVKAIHQHINARHDALEKGWNAWANYMYTDERIRQGYYAGSDVMQNAFHVGADYVLAEGDAAAPYSRTPSFSVGGAYSFASVRAKREDGSTLSANVNTLTAYASARWWRLYLDVLAEYSPDAQYKAEIDREVPFDMDGTVKGSRAGTSAELGIITNPPRLGQLEIYTQFTAQRHDFNSVSSIQEPAHLTGDDGYNPIYDPGSPNGRRYRFDAPTSIRTEFGLRWGSHLIINDRWAIRPWGGVAYGRITGNDYLVYVDDRTARNDMNGNYHTLQGGASALLGKNLQFYLTLGYTGGDASNNYTILSGVNYHW